VECLGLTYGLQLYLLRRDQGRLEDVEQLVRRSAMDYPTYPICRCVLASMLAELGSTDEARAELEALAADGFSGIPFDEEWQVSQCFLAEAAAHIGDRDHAGTLYGLLLPYADRVAMSYPEVSLGSVSRFLGILACTTDHYHQAAGHFEDAVAMNERIGARPWLARTQDDYGHLLLRRGEPGDTERAESLLDGARRAYRELGIQARTPSFAPPFPSRR
jgi:tetratricopeptide (TPR) repeat protein